MRVQLRPLPLQALSLRWGHAANIRRGLPVSPARHSPTFRPSRRWEQGQQWCVKFARHYILDKAGGKLDDSQDRPAQAPQREEFISPEMTRAGVLALWAYDAQADSAAETVREIFLAMSEARDPGLAPEHQFPRLLANIGQELLGSPSLQTEPIAERLSGLSALPA